MPFSFFSSSMIRECSLKKTQIEKKKLSNSLRHSRLNGCFHEDFENKSASVFSLIFPIFTAGVVISV